MRHLGRVTHGLGDLGFDQVPKASAQPVNSDPHRAFVQAERTCNINLGVVRGLTGQPWFQQREFAAGGRVAR
jgi:hypothetical protein